ncbi:MAG: AraC family transcriptional regulator, partial [Myxococcota bacterium]
MSVANTVMLPALLNILGTLREQGLPMGELLNAAGLRPSVFDPIDFDARIPTSAVLAVYDYAARALDDPAVSIRIAEGQKPEHLSVVGFVIATAATGVEAITRAARYARVAFDYGVDWQVFEEDDVIRISFPTSPTTLAERIATEVGVAAFLHYFRTMGRQDVVPNNVVFSHAAPADARAHKAFFRGSIRWGAGVPGFAFDAAYAERMVLPKADRSMNQFFERYADDLLEQMQRGTTA